MGVLEVGICCSLKKNAVVVFVVVPLACSFTQVVLVKVGQYECSELLYMKMNPCRHVESNDAHW